MGATSCPSTLKDRPYPAGKALVFMGRLRERQAGGLGTRPGPALPCTATRDPRAPAVVGPLCPSATAQTCGCSGGDGSSTSAAGLPFLTPVKARLAGKRPGPGPAPGTEFNGLGRGKDALSATISAGSGLAGLSSPSQVRSSTGLSLTHIHVSSFLLP